MGTKASRKHQSKRPSRRPPSSKSAPPAAAKSSVPPSSVVLLTRRELAGVMNVHMQTVSKWEQDGLPVAERGRGGKPSLYREEDVRAWLAQREEAAKNNGFFDVAQERARKERAQAQLAEQTFQMRQRDLLPRQDVERVWGAEVAAVRTKLMAWSTTIADRVHRAATLDGIAGVEHELREAVENVLRELADPERISELPPPPVDGADDDGRKEHVA